MRRQQTSGLVLMFASLLAVVLAGKCATSAKVLAPRAIGQISYDSYSAARKARTDDFHLYDNGRDRRRYVYHRVIDVRDRHGNQYELTVDGDRLTYVFDYQGNLLTTMSQWRNIGDLPVIRVTQEQAESIAQTFSHEDVMSSQLVLMDPRLLEWLYIWDLVDSPVTHPCWVVRTSSYCRTGPLLIDALTWEILGHGSPPC